MSLVLLFHYLMLNMFRMLIHPSSGACDLFVELFHGLYCSGSVCVGVTLWFGCGGVVSVCRLRHWSAYLMLKLFRMLIHPSSGACDLFVKLFHGLYCNTTHEITQQISRKLLSDIMLVSLYSTRQDEANIRFSQIYERPRNYHNGKASINGRYKLEW